MSLLLASGAAPPATPLVNGYLHTDNPIRKRQTGSIDLFPNLVLTVMAAATVLVARTPLYVNKPTKFATQIEQPQNLVVRMSQTATRLIPASESIVRPSKRWVQPDLYPNLTVRIGSAVRLAPTQDIQTEPSARWPQPDLLPNLAVGMPVQILGTRQPLVVNRPSARWQQPDSYPNLAARLTPASSTLRINPLVDPATKPLEWTQPDLYPNLTIGMSQATFIFSISDDAKPLRWPTVDLVPNLAVSMAAAPAAPIQARQPFFMQYPRTAEPQIDLFPNIAVRLTPAAPALRIAAMVEPPIKPLEWTQPDLFPNLTIGMAQVTFIFTVSDDVKATKWPSVDVLPNLAANMATPVPPPPIMVTGAFFMRYPKPAVPQVDVFPNLAIGMAPFVPPVVPPSGGGGGSGGGWGDFHFKDKPRIKTGPDAAQLAKDAGGFSVDSDTNNQWPNDVTGQDEDDDDEAIWILLS